MKYFSMFSGIGGFELGIQQAYENNLKYQHISKESKQEECSQGRFGTTNEPREVLCVVVDHTGANKKDEQFMCSDNYEA